MEIQKSDFYTFHGGLLKKGPTQPPWRLISALIIIAFALPLGHASAPGTETLRVKGLYIGMPLDVAVKTAATLTDITHYRLQPFNLSEFKFRKFESDAHRHWFCDLRNAVVSPLVFAADAEKKLTFIAIQGTLVEQLFESHKDSAEAFAQRFARAHDLPAMTPFQQSGQSPLPNILPDSGWRFLSPLGYKITVYSNKDIDIEKIAPLDEKSDGTATGH